MKAVSPRVIIPWNVHFNYVIDVYLMSKKEVKRFCGRVENIDLYTHRYLWTYRHLQWGFISGPGSVVKEAEKPHDLAPAAGGPAEPVGEVGPSSKPENQWLVV